MKILKSNLIKLGFEEISKNKFNYKNLTIDIKRFRIINVELEVEKLSEFDYRDFKNYLIELTEIPNDFMDKVNEFINYYNELSANLDIRKIEDDFIKEFDDLNKLIKGIVWYYLSNTYYPFLEGRYSYALERGKYGQSIYNVNLYQLRQLRKHYEKLLSIKSIQEWNDDWCIHNKHLDKELRFKKEF